MYSFRTSLGPVELAFTDRLGGVSASPYDALNLSISGDDSDAAKAENHRLLVEDFAPEVADLGREQGSWGFFDLFQVHGNAVHVVEERNAPGRPEADGIVTALVTAPLMVRAADCVPVLLADPASGVIGAAHAGRKGVESSVVVQTVAEMRRLGAGAIEAWIGPYICGACYEVPQQMQDDVEALAPGSRSTTSWGTPGLDLGAGLRAQLEALDVEVHLDAVRCTLESADLHSYRRDGAASGRHAGIIRLREAVR